MEITDIRYEGFYIAEDDGNLCIEHTRETMKLLDKAINLIDEDKYYACDGVIFINGVPYAELVTTKYDKTEYVKIV